ncbi:MAG TPA: hypothetical protein VGI13_01565 [Candidatus Acidoferrum sp.]|jgi:hypothetical protein
MAITFQKRQKEMKRQEKQREKAERREQRKLAKRAEKEAGIEQPGDSVEVVDTVPPESEV